MNNYRKLFWSNNYVLIRNAFNKYESKFISNYANKIVQNTGDKKPSKYYEKNGNLCRIENFLDTNQGLKYFIKYKVEPIASDVYGGNINLFKDKINCKYPGGEGFRAHQDHPAWTDFNSKFYFTVAMFPDKASVSNGCLQFAETKFLDRTYDHDFSDGGALCKEVEKNLKWHWVEANPEDLLIFNSYAPHRSFTNNTKDSRKIVYLTYNDSNDGDFYYSYIQRKKSASPGDVKYNLANPIIIN